MNFIEIIKKHKIFVSVVLCVIFLLYAGFVFVLPAILNLNNYKDDIQKLVQQSVKLNLDFQDIKLVTTPGLKAGVNISGLNLSYPDGKNIVQLQNAQAKVELLPLIFKTVKISDITAESPSLSVEFLADGNIDIVEYITKNLEQSAQTTQTTTAELPVKISPNLPVVTVTDYSLTLKDKLSSNSISIKGNNFIFDKAVLNKHFRVTTDGKILVNKNTNINYDIKFSSFWPVFKTNEQTGQTTTAPDIDFIQELVKYNPTADIKADIAAKEHEGHIDLDGYLNIDKLSIKLNGKKLPDSYFHLLAKGHETNIDSVVYVSKDEKAGVKSNITTGRKTLVDLNLNTDKNLWIIGNKSIEEIGCIHTCQGLELDYVGVIIGSDMRYENGQIITDVTKRSGNDQSVKGFKHLLSQNRYKALQDADEIIKNTYRTLLTRGMKGCYVYCCDKPLAEYLSAQLEPLYESIPENRIEPEVNDEVKYIDFLPLYSIRAACGYFGEGELVDESGWMKVEGMGKLNRNMFIVQAVGHSMEPLIQDGDYCVFRANPAGSRQGKVVLTEHHNYYDSDYMGSYSIKTYTSKKIFDPEGSWAHEEIVLQPKNSNYSPIIIEEENADEFRIVGEFIGVLPMKSKQ